MKKMLLLLVLALASFLVNAENASVGQDVDTPEPIGSIRYVSGAK